MVELIIFIITAIVLFNVSKNFLQYQKLEEKDYLDDKVIDVEIVQENTQNSNNTLSQTEAGLIVALVSKVSNLDDKISPFEEAFKEATFVKLGNYFSDKNEMIDIFEDIYTNEAKNISNLIDIAHQYYQETDFNYQKRLNLLNYILILLYIDNQYDKKSDIIKDIYKTLRISQNDFDNTVELIEKTINSIEIQTFKPMDIKEFKEAVFMSLPDVINDNFDDKKLEYIITVLYTLNHSIKDEGKE